MTTNELAEKMPPPIIAVTPAINANSLSIPECETISIDASPISMLLNTFIIRKKEYCVMLSAGKLVWERVKSKNDRITVLIENILTVQPQVKHLSVHKRNQQQQHQQQQHDQSVCETVDTQNTTPNIKQFTIVYTKRMENSSNSNIWRHFSQTFHNNDSQVCQLWVETLQRQIDGKNQFCIRIIG